MATGAAEQTYAFYGPSQISFHGMGCAVAIGANCTFRRKALESIGGHDIGLAEAPHHLDSHPLKRLEIHLQPHCRQSRIGAGEPRLVLQAADEVGTGFVRGGIFGAAKGLARPWVLAKIGNGRVSRFFHTARRIDFFRRKNMGHGRLCNGGICDVAGRNFRGAGSAFFEG